MPDRPEPSRSLPAGPTDSAWEQAKAWIDRPIDFWNQCHATFGDTFTLQFGSLGPTVVFCHPEAVRQIFAIRPEHYECKSFNDHYRYLMGNRSLLVLDGEEHRQQRGFLRPFFQQSEQDRWISIAIDITHRQMRNVQDGEVICVRRFVHEISLRLILKLVFRDAQQSIQKLLRKIFIESILENYGTWSPWARFVQWHDPLRKLFGSEIRRLQDLPSSSSQLEDLSLFQQLARHQQNGMPALTGEQIQDHVFTMLIAGVDPAAIATSWAIYWILESEGVSVQLREELNDFETLSNERQFLSRTDSYLHAVCLETLRMYPVVTTPSGRKLLKPVAIDSQVYPAGVTLVPATYLVHHRADLYPDPERFMPSRFLDRTYQGSEFFPFGGGRRRCIGAGLALTAMKSILFLLFSSWHLNRAWKDRIHPVRHGTLLAPSDNLRARVNAQLSNPGVRVT